MRKGLLKKTASILTLSFTVLSLNPNSVFAIDLMSPDSPAAPRQGEITVEASMARTEADPGQELPEDFTFETLDDSSPLSSPSLTGAEIESNSAQALSVIAEKGETVSKTLQKRITALSAKYKETPLGNITAGIQEGLNDTQNSSIIPQSQRARELADIINSPDADYASKLTAYTELDSIREDFENGSTASKIQSIKDDAQYVEDIGNIISPLWDQARTLYSNYSATGAEFKTQASSLTSQMKALAAQYPDVLVSQNEIKVLMQGLADTVARQDSDEAAVKALLDSITGTRNPNDVRARLRLLTDAVSNNNGFYMEQITYYASELEYARNKVQELSELIAEGREILTSIETQAALVSGQIESMLIDAAQLKQSQEGSSISVPLTDLENQLLELKKTLTRGLENAQSLFSDIQTRRSLGEINGLLKHLTDAAQPFDPLKDSGLTSITASLEIELGHYRSLAADYDRAKNISGEIASSTLPSKIDALVPGFTALGETLILKELDSLASAIAKDKEKAADLLSKILAARDPNTSSKLLIDMQEVHVKFSPASKSAEIGAMSQSYYPERVDFYTASLITAQKRAALLNDLKNDGKKLIASITEQSAAVSKQIDSLSADLSLLKEDPQADSFSTEIRDLENKISVLKKRLGTETWRAQSIFENLQKQTTPEDAQILMAQLVSVSQPFDPLKKLEFFAEAAALRGELDLYRNLTKAYAGAKTVSAAILSSPFYQSVNDLVTGFKEVGNAALLKEVTALASEITADKTKTQGLLDKVLLSRDLAAVEKLTAELTGISLKFQSTPTAPGYYAGKIDYYAAELIKAQKKKDPLINKYLAQAKQILASLEARSSVISRQIDSFLESIEEFKNKQGEALLETSIIELESKTLALKKQLVSDTQLAKALYQNALSKNSSKDILLILNQLSEAAKPFNYSNESGYKFDLSALKEELRTYKKLAASYRQARSLSASILSSSIFKRVDDLAASFKALGDVSAYKESKEIASDLAAVQNSLKADKAKTEELLGKILSTRDPQLVEKYLSEMREVQSDFIRPGNTTSYSKVITNLRLKIQVLKTKKTTDELKEKLKLTKKK